MAVCTRPLSSGHRRMPIFSISVGRLDYLFTGYERSESSKKINTIERGLLVNQIMPAEVVGAHLTGTTGPFFLPRRVVQP